MVLSPLPRAASTCPPGAKANAKVPLAGPLNRLSSLPAVVSCKRMELSAFARATVRPSGENAADVVRAGAGNEPRDLPVADCQRRTTRSAPQETTVLPSAERTRVEGARQWLSTRDTSLPVAVSHRRMVAPA